MSERPDMPALIDQLGEAAMECRRLLADVRTATKDLRAAVKEANEARDELADAVKAMVDTQVNDAVRASLDDLKAHFKAGADDAVAAVHRKVDQVTNILLTGNRQGRPTGGLDLLRLGETDGAS